MQLTYRAARYNLYSPRLSVIVTERVGIYRGTPTPIKFAYALEKAKTLIQLKYRGVSYCYLG